MILEYQDMDKDYCVELAYKHKQVSKLQYATALDKHLLIGYDIYCDGYRVGVVFCKMVDGLYTLDAYDDCHDGRAGIIALKSGRMMMDMLFEKYTSVIYTQHLVEETKLTKLCEMLGFVEIDNNGIDIIMAAGDIVRPKFKNMILLSGGKDSCSLAYNMNPKNTLAFTYDNGFLSSTALSNIKKVVEHTGLTHMFYKANNYTHQVLMGHFLQQDKQKMTDICSACSRLLFEEAIYVAKNFGIKRIYAGFTKYTAIVHDGSLEETTYIDGIEIVNPYKTEYDLDKIKDIISVHGLEFDPLKTNCVFIETIIEKHKHRHGTHPFGEEAELLLKDGQISQEEYNYYIR